MAKLHLIFLMCLLVLGCKKKDKEEAVPVASFTSDKTEYTSGEVIRITNTSKDAKTFRWTLPSGETSRERDIAFQTPSSAVPSVAQFKLEAFSKSGEKSDLVVRNFAVKPASGKVVFYGGFIYPFNIYIDGADKGQHSITIMDSSSFTPADCDAPGFPKFELPVGTHNATAQYGTYVISRTFTVTPNGCSKVLF